MDALKEESANAPAASRACVAQGNASAGGSTVGGGGGFGQAAEQRLTLLNYSLDEMAGRMNSMEAEVVKMSEMILQLTQESRVPCATGWIKGSWKACFPDCRRETGVARAGRDLVSPMPPLLNFHRQNTTIRCWAPSQVG